MKTPLKTIDLRLLAALSLLAGLAGAQTPFRTHLGSSAFQHAGHALANVGDLDGDGREDLAVGSPGYDGPGSARGRVQVFSGRTGLVLVDVIGLHDGDALGASFAALDDIDGDGTPDFASGVPGLDTKTRVDIGGVAFLSGASGVLLALYTNPSFVSAGAALGRSLAAVGDVNGDGFADLIAGAPFALVGTGGAKGGVAHLISGKLGVLLRTHGTSVDGARFGWSVAGLGDLDADGRPEYAIGIPGSEPTGLTDSGSVSVYSGDDGAFLWRSVGISPDEGLGAALIGISDLTGDGLPDYVASSLSNGASTPGKVRVYSGNYGAQVYWLQGQALERLGASLVAMGDLDGDGRGDFAAGAPFLTNGIGMRIGAARVYSGIDGGLIDVFTGSEHDALFGSALAAPDENGDGARDLAIGAPLEDRQFIGTIFDAGAVYTRLMNAPEPVVYCTAKTNSLGCVPMIASTGVPSLGTLDDFHVRASQVRNQKPGVMLWSLQPAVSLFQGGLLCLATPIKRTPAQNAGGNAVGNDCSGSFDFHFDSVYAAQHQLPPGLTVHAQYWSRDAQAAFGTGLTDALAFTLLQ